MCCFLMSEEPNRHNLSCPFSPSLCLFWRVLTTGPVMCCRRRRAGPESRSRLCICSHCLSSVFSRPCPSKHQLKHGHGMGSLLLFPAGLHRGPSAGRGLSLEPGLREGGCTARASPSSLCPSAGAARPMGMGVWIVWPDRLGESGLSHSGRRRAERGAAGPAVAPWRSASLSGASPSCQAMASGRSSSASEVGSGWPGGWGFGGLGGLGLPSPANTLCLHSASQGFTQKTRKVCCGPEAIFNEVRKLGSCRTCGTGTGRSVSWS